jgi:hypothetical protein
MPQFVSSSVQFVGADNVKKAFHNVGVVNWALFNGKSLLEKYDGDNEAASIDHFNQFIDALNSNGSESLYRLQTYEDLKHGEKIKPSTECDRSFQFKLYDRYGNSGGSMNPGRNTAFEDKILNELSAMKTEIAMLKQDDGEGEEKVSGIGASLMRLLEMPVVQAKIGQVFEHLADQIIPPRKTTVYTPPPPASTPAALNGVPSSDEAVQIDKINSAIVTLYSYDPLLGDHLQKLAAIAANDTGQYNKLISMLNNLF